MRTRPLPSPAMIVACVALFLALGGTGYAAGHFTAAGGKERVSKKKQQAKRGPRGRRGLRGPQGLPGPVGPVGPKGAEGFGLLDYEEGEPEETPAGKTTFVSVDCPPGLNAVGGGVRTEEPELQVVNSSYPAIANQIGAGANRWSAVVTNLSEEDLSAQAFAICARTASVSGQLLPEV